MQRTSTLFRSKLVGPILFTGLLPLSFRSSIDGTEFVFLGGRNSMAAIAIWAVCVTLAVVAFVRSRRPAVRSQT
jgi:hypothetical protein